MIRIEEKDIYKVSQRTLNANILILSTMMGASRSCYRNRRKEAFSETLTLASAFRKFDSLTSPTSYGSLFFHVNLLFYEKFSFRGAMELLSAIHDPIGLDR